ncbi:unnamed protein product [Protopolystoma xenopodis]|uniref:Serine-threonine/tyrosine-protein kinase catalytic domain-containing protein n=1 Tax=Protopolystoma xenopodis TaxID=117903 RepID=A0A448XN00_9PLAT|nr:unnamed protein product [Protopolystoma xenopodis]
MHVIVKSLTSRTPVQVAEFERQVELFARADNDYVVRFVGVCRTLEPYYLVLEHSEWVGLFAFYQLIVSTLVSQRETQFLFISTGLFNFPEMK